MINLLNAEDRDAQLAFKCSAESLTGVVGTAAPEAAVVGRDILKAGGNAFDAALAAALVETVLLPTKCGLAGDLVSLVSQNGAPPKALIGIGKAPQRLGRHVADTGVLATVGGVSVGIPGAPAGYAAIHTLCSMPLSRLVEPAFRFATDGFRWSPVNERYTRIALENKILDGKYAGSYVRNGQPMPAGTWMRFPGHAQALKMFIERKEKLFDGGLADEFVRTVCNAGGLVTYEDLGDQEAYWCDAEMLETDEFTLWATPAPTYGPILLEQFRRGMNSSILERQRDAVNATHSMHSPGSSDAGTSIISCGDKQGNAIILVHSLSHPTFGSGLVLDDLGLVLSNRAGRGFNCTPGNPNFPQRGRRPRTTLHAWSLRRTGWPRSYFGATSGGEQQPVWNGQIIARILQDVAPGSALMRSLWAQEASGPTIVESDVLEEKCLGPDIETIPPLVLPAGIQVLTMNDDASMPMQVVSDLRAVGGVAGV